MNKQGAFLSDWMEGSVVVVLFLLCVTIIIISMNVQYTKVYDPTFGLSSPDTQTALNDYQGQLKTGLSGDASTNSVTGGINLLSSWGVAKAGFSLVSDFVSGAWLQNAVGLLGWGQAGIALGLALRMLFIFSLIFILIRLIFKVAA